MEHWWEIAIAVVIVTTVSLLFGLDDLPSGAGKLFASLGAAIIPVLVIQFRKMKEYDNEIPTGEFVFSLILNTFLVLTFSMILEMTIKHVCSKI